VIFCLHRGLIRDTAPQRTPTYNLVGLCKIGHVLVNLHPLTLRYFELMQSAGLTANESFIEETEQTFRQHVSEMGPHTGTGLLALAGQGVRATISALQQCRTGDAPITLPEITELEALAMRYAEQRLVMAGDFMLSLGKLMEHDCVPIFSWAPLARSTVEVSTMAWRILGPLDQSHVTAADRQLFVARYLNHRIARLRGLSRDSIDKFLAEVMDPAELDESDAGQRTKLQQIYDWAANEEVQRFSKQAKAHPEGTYLVEPLPSVTRRIEEYFESKAEGSISSDGGAALGASYYQNASTVAHGDPDAAEARTGPNGGIGLRADDYALTMTLAVVADATYRFQRAVVGQDWSPSVDTEMIHGVTIGLLNALDSRWND